MTKPETASCPIVGCYIRGWHTHETTTAGSTTLVQPWPTEPKTARELLDNYRVKNEFRRDALSTNYTAEHLASRVERVLDYCDEGFHECIVEHLKQIRRILNGEPIE